MKYRWISLVLLMAIALTGCASPQPIEAGQEPEPMEPQAPNPTSGVVEVSPLATPTPDSDAQLVPLPTDPILQNLIAKSIEDLAQRLSISADQIKIQEAIEVIWPDSSLGCTNPASQYMQVVTPGYLIRFQAHENMYEYHADKNNKILYCETPSLAPPGILLDK